MLQAAEREALKACLTHAVDALRSLQHQDGHWCGELEGDSILQSEYLLMKFILQQEDESMADGRDGPKTLARIADYLRRQQRDDGGWGQFPGSSIDISGTVKAYFALKLMGDAPEAPHMRMARRVILELGGAEQCNSFSKFYLAALGQLSWNACPAIPPEIVYLPRWFYFHLSKVSAWTRTMILPLSLVVSLRPVRQLRADQGIDELFVDPANRNRFVSQADAPKAWSLFFHGLDKLLKLTRFMGGPPFRRMAIRRAERWIIERAGQDGAAATDGLGAIFPPMVYIQIAFKALGYKRDHEIMQRAEAELDEFFLEDERGIHIQPCFSPVWDTGIATFALNDCGLDATDGAVAQAAAWLRGKECFHQGDWKDELQTPTNGGCWAFEYHNAWYPDSDDTAMVAMALKRSGGPENEAAAQRGVDWVLAMQNRDGGWAAFDRTRDRRILEYIPFADHNAMQDPSCPDITGRVLECLYWNGLDITHPAIRRAVGYVRRQQQPDGCWIGRWGVNYIYGTWQAVIGPLRCGADAGEAWVRQAGAWMKSVQKPDGSFGETALSYEDPALKGRGPSTASQTAWAAMVLQEIFGKDDPDLQRAIHWLMQTQLDPEAAADPKQNPDHDPAGSWHEPWFTGTGFPRVFYLRYHMYRLYFPIMAIGRYLAAHGTSLQPPFTARIPPKIQAASNGHSKRTGNMERQGARRDGMIEGQLGSVEQ